MSESLDNRLLAMSIMDDIFDHLKHGDDAHQEWLRNRLKDFVTPLFINLEAAEIRGLIKGMK